MPPKTLHLIRHAQGYHNLSLSAHNIHDPELTPLGQTQCAHLSSTFPAPLSSISCIVASPMRRTLQTALLTFSSHLRENPNLRIIALPEIQETSNVPCDTGSDISVLREEFKDAPVDFSLVGDAWNHKDSGPFSARYDMLEARAHKARLFLQAREEEVVAAVLHGSILHFVTQDWEGSIGGIGTGWKNAEVRTYVFDEGSEESRANGTIVETEESRSRRGALVLDPEEQEEMRRKTQKQWADSGYIILPDATTGKAEDVQSLL